MDENNPSSSLKNNFVAEIEKLEISGTDAGVRSTKVEGSDSESGVDADSDFKNLSDIDRKLSELQCPFTWLLPSTGIVLSEMILSLTDMDKELEEDGHFSTRGFIRDLLLVYELCNNDKLEEANKKLIVVLDSTKDLYDSCEDELFVKMKNPVEHVMLSCKAHFLKAYISKFPVHKELHWQDIIKILETVCPYSKMTESEQAGMYYLKAQAFSEYGHNGCVEGLDLLRKAIELDPKESQWYFRTGKLMAKIRRNANWNEHVEKEELKLFEMALELQENTSYLVGLASSYVDCTKNICRNMQLDKETRIKVYDMNARTKQLYIRSIQLKPDDARINICCARGMLKLPKHFMDNDLVRKCIKVALDKAPNSGLANHIAGMFAERQEYNIEKALHHYEISSNHFEGMADYRRLKYIYDKDYDLIGALEKMLENSWTLRNKLKALSYIGSYYLFLKRDLFHALQYYGKIIEEDSGSSAITAHKPMFLNMRAPINMYEILCTEVHLKLNENKLSKGEVNALKEFINKLDQIDSLTAENFARKPSQIQEIMDKSRKLDEKYKETIRRKQFDNERFSVNRGRGSRRCGVQNSRR